MTVSVGALTYGTCSKGSSTPTQLGFPNGVFSTATYTVTNGNTPAFIDVAGADAVPSSGTPPTPWTLVILTTPAQDQYKEVLAGAAPLQLSNFSSCDTNFGTTCAPAAAGAASSEQVVLTGPSSSTDGSSTFTTTITYTAL